MHVLTNRGWIVVHISKDRPKPSSFDEDASETQSQHAMEAKENTYKRGLGYSLSTDRRWIRWRDQNIV